MSTIIVTQQAKQTVNIVKEVNKTVEIYRKGEKGDKGDQGIQGIQGIQGAKGDTGLSGIAIGGTIGQLIAKKSLTDYDTEWVNPVDISGKLDKNTEITGATKTKITYDTKGLVTSGADATTADIADSLNKRYVTDANLTVIGNTSNTNTGDQTLSSLGAEAVANKSISVTTDGTSDTKYPSVKAVKDYADSLVVGLLDYRGGYNASVNTWPVSGGSGTAGAVVKGDMWVISVIGTLGGVAVQTGDSIIANIDTPNQTAANWNTLNSNISYVPEDQANKVTSISSGSTDIQYPSAKLLYDQSALKVPYTGATGSVTLGSYDLTATIIKSTITGAETVTSAFTSYSPSATYPFANFLIGDKVGDVQGGLMIACGGTDATHNKPAQLILSTNKNVVLAGSKQLYITQNATTVFGTYIAGDPSASASPIVFSPGGTESVRFLTNGNVGIGTTAPTAKLHIKGTTLLQANSSSYGYSDMLSIIENTASPFLNIYPTHVYGGQLNIGPSTEQAGQSINFNLYGRVKIKTGLVAPAGNAYSYPSTGANNFKVWLYNSPDAGEGFDIIRNAHQPAYNAPATLRLVMYNNGSAGGALIANRTIGGLEFTGANGTDYTDGASIWSGNDTNFSTSVGYGDLRFNTNNGAASTSERMRISQSGNVGIGTTTPTSYLHIKAGTATASTAPIKLTSGVLLTVPEAGAIEFVTGSFYGTSTMNVRNKFAFISDLTTSYVPYTGATGAVNLGAYDLTLQGITIGKGNNAVTYNTAIGKGVLFFNSTGDYNTGFGYSALQNNTSGNYNTAGGVGSLGNNSTAHNNTGFGYDTLFANNGSDNTALGYLAGGFITGGATMNTGAGKGVYIGASTKAYAISQANEIVVGYDATGHGTNTVTIGNSLITANYFVGSINGGSFVKSGGTSSQFLKADGSVDIVAYQTALINPVTGTGTANYIPKFSGGTSIVDSLIYDNGTNVGIGTATPAYLLTVNGQPGANGYTAFTNYSDIRLKDNIEDMSYDAVLPKIMALHPVAFNYNSLSGFDQKTRDRRIKGFIAQELIDVFPEMVGEVTINGGKYYDTNLSDMTLYLIKAIQELNTELVSLKQTLNIN